jgi:hypothetical protein
MGRRKNSIRASKFSEAQVAFIFERVRIRSAWQREKQFFVVIRPRTSASGFRTFNLKNPRGFQLRRLRAPRA